MGNRSNAKGLSIIIPNYNFICIKLVEDLCSQCKECILTDRYEILVYDDASTDLDTVSANRVINSFPYCTYREHNVNKGRSRLRNQLIRDARYQYILIIDSDAEVCCPSFIQHYMEAIVDNDIVIGGIQTSERYKRPDNLLRFRYEMSANRSIRMLDYCNRHPYMHFSTFNAIFQSYVFDQVMFSENVIGYGFEDTLLGADLEKAGFRILHIDNPLIHTGIDSTDHFLAKTEEGLRNLCLLYNRIGNHSTLCKWYDCLHRWHLHRVMAALHTWIVGWERRNLYGKNPSLKVFHLYKLGRFAQIMAHR